MRREATLGGGGNVVENLRSLGVQAEVFGVVGDDETGEQVRALLGKHGVDLRGVIRDSRRSSTRKVRLISLEHGQQVFRLDEESNRAISSDIEDQLIGMILERVEHIQVILCSDYMKGVLTDRVLNQTFTAARMRGIPAIVAPKDSNPRRYLGANVLMPNARELAQLMGTPVVGGDWLEKSARKLIGDLGLQALVVTRGAEGMSLFERTGNSVCRVDIATTARSVYDVTGAGTRPLPLWLQQSPQGCRLRMQCALRISPLASRLESVAPLVLPQTNC